MRPYPRTLGVLLLSAALLVAGPAAFAAVDVPVTVASYAGNGAGAESQNAVEIAPDGTVVCGGTSESEPGVPVIALGGSTGRVTRMAADGHVLSVSAVGRSVDDLDVNRATGEIAVLTDTELRVLAPGADAVLWSRALAGGGGATGGTGRRVAVGADGTVVALHGATVSIFDAAGGARGSFAVGGGFAEDVAVDTAGGLVFLTGFRNGDGVQIAFLTARAYDGTTRWTDYDHADVGANRADTRGYRVSMGRDGKLYFAGESAGGNSIFHSQPRDLGSRAPLVKTDLYNDPYNLQGAAHITFAARLDPASGSMEVGTWVIARLPADKGRKGNTIRPRAITADEDGNVSLGGAAAYGLPGQDAVTFSGVPRPGEYAGGAWVLTLGPDFATRRLFASFGGSGEVRGLAAGAGVSALAGAAGGDDLVTVNPLPGQATAAANVSGEATDGYLAIWSGPSAGSAPPPPAASPPPPPTAVAPAPTAVAAPGPETPSPAAPAPAPPSPAETATAAPAPRTRPAAEVAQPALARTGVNPVLPLVAAALLLIGAGLLLLDHERRSAAASASHDREHPAGSRRGRSSR